MIIFLTKILTYSIDSFLSFLLEFLLAVCNIFIPHFVSSLLKVLPSKLQIFFINSHEVANFEPKY